MDGGPSQVDTFDPKPRLEREHGQPIKVKTHPTQFNNVGNVLACPWKFRRYGESGIPVSDLFPHVAERVDDLAIIRSMVSNFSEHTNANYFMHTGSGLQGRPSHGAWVTYGLGSECQNLPAFVVLNGGLIPPGGMDCFNSGFLPAAYQGSVFRPSGEPVANIAPLEPARDQQRRKLDLLRTLDQGVLGRMGRHDALEAAIANYELAFKMQSAVPELMSLSGETAATQRLYGVDDAYPPTAIFARECLIARRLVERGVRFIEVLCPNVGADRWDQHSDLKSGHERNARATDKPIAALLADLKARGLFESTLVVWAGEFGRTPMAQGTDGRDHNPYGFTIWLAGGRNQGGHDLRRDRRLRLPRRREQGRDPRPSRHDAPPAGHGPQATHVPLRRPRHAAHRRARRDRHRHSRVMALCGSKWQVLGNPFSARSPHRRRAGGRVSGARRAKMASSQRTNLHDFMPEDAACIQRQSGAPVGLSDRPRDHCQKPRVCHFFGDEGPNRRR